MRLVAFDREPQLGDPPGLVTVSVAGLPFRSELVQAEGPGDDFGDVDSAYRRQQGMKALLRSKNPPSAAVAINDMYAIGACAAVHEEGLRVPQDVSVVGFDDIMTAALCNPPLTIRQPLEEMTRYAVEAIQRLQRDPATAQTTAVIMGPSLVIRKSTAAPAMPGSLA